MPESGSAAVGGGDPSERFGELLDCGCEWHAGTVFYCEEHLPRPQPSPKGTVLDLRAVEVLAQVCIDDGGDYLGLPERTQALLAHCRALRAALLYARKCILIEASGAGPTPDFGRIDAVLAQATDERRGA